MSRTKVGGLHLEYIGPGMFYVAITEPLGCVAVAIM